MVNIYRATRQFERLLFSGVPEQPEPSYERDNNASYIDRKTGKSRTTNLTPYIDEEEDQLIATIVYNPSKKEITIERKQKE